MSARSTLLRGIRSGHKFDRSAGPFLLVAKHPLEHRPACICDSASAASAQHPRDVQIFQHDDTVTLGDACGLNVQEMSALPSHLAVLTRDATLGLLPVLGSFLSTSDSPLRTTQSFQRSLQVLRPGDQIALRRSRKVDNAAIDRDHRAWSRSWIWDRDLADDRGEPLISVTNERAGLWRAFKRAMDDSSDLAELGKIQRITLKTPRLRMRFTQVDDVEALALPSWSVCALLKAALPRFIQLVEKLHRHITRNVRKPRQLRSKLGQIFRLIKRGHVAALVTIFGQSEKPLLVREVPEEPQSITPTICCRNLLARWIDAIAEGFADQHSVLGNTVVRQSTRRGLLPPWNGKAFTLDIR